MSYVPNRLIILTVVFFLQLSDAYAANNPPPPKAPPPGPIPPGLPVDNWIMPVLLLAGIYAFYKIKDKKKGLS